MEMTEYERFLINTPDRIGATVVMPHAPAFAFMYKLGLVGSTGGMTRMGQIIRGRVMRRLEDEAFSA